MQQCSWQILFGFECLVLLMADLIKPNANRSVLVVSSDSFRISGLLLEKLEVRSNNSLSDPNPYVVAVSRQ